MPKVSVILPLYNASKYIVRTIQSLQAQTFKNFEVIVVNDCSKDNSIDVLEEYLKYNNTNFIVSVISHSKNRGVSAARNTGIRLAMGTYCAFIDADDMWEPTKLQEHVDFLEANPDVGLSYDCSSFIDEEDNLLGLYQTPKKFDNLTADYMLLRNPVSNGSVPVIRTDAIRKVLFDESLHNCEDLECWVRFFHHSGYTIEGINKLLTLYRVHNSSASSLTLNQINSLKEVLVKTSKYAPELVSKYGTLALAYQYRFVARRAIKDGRPTIAVTYINKSLVTDLRIVVQEPVRTMITIIAAYVLSVVPKKVYESVLNKLMFVTNKSKVA